MAADIGCDHGKLSAALAGSGRCPLVLACDLRPGPLEKARVTCAPYGDKVQFRLGSGLQVLAPGEAEEIIIAGMGAETIIEILEAAPWVFDGRYNLVLVPATKHSILRRWLARRGFALKAETLCQAAGRWYAVMNAQYTGAPCEPDGLYCLTGLTQGQPGCADYYASQNAKLKKYRRRKGRGGGAYRGIGQAGGRLNAHGRIWNPPLRFPFMGVDSMTRVSICRGAFHMRPHGVALHTNFQEEPSCR